MINVVLFAVNIIIAYFIWTFALKPSILDHFRDQLFDLREDVRSFYLSNDIPLTDKTYKSLRDSINGHLRFTEKKSLVKTIKFIVEINKNKKLSKKIEKEIEKMFFTTDKKLKEFIDHSRSNASMVLLRYMFCSSPIMMFCFFVMSLFIIIKTISLNICNSGFMKNKAHDIEEYSMTHYRFNP
mgnify:CR=1 FL=1